MGCATSSHVYDVAQEQEFYHVSPQSGEAKRSHLEEPQENRSFHKEYLITSKLGKGAFAHVYKAQKDPNPDAEKYAVKITDLRTKTGHVTIDQKCNRQVEREISIMQKVSGVDNCIKLVDLFVEARRSYIVMEMCDSTLLGALKSNKELNENTMKPYVIQMFQAVSAIHRIGIIHRDIKPSNFLLKTTESGSVLKLVDFGLASTLPGGGGEPLIGVCGTPPFMCPEMVMQQPYGAKSDVWSLGVNLYILLCGRFPYTPVDQTGKGMKAAVATGGPVYLEDKAMSKNAKALLAGLLKRNSNERLTAEQALRSSWCTKSSTDGLACLKPLLQAARKLGAFEEDNAMDQSPSSVEMENHVRLMQTKIRMEKTRSDASSLKGKEMAMDGTFSTNSTVTPSNSDVSIDSSALSR